MLPSSLCVSAVALAVFAAPAFAQTIVLQAEDGILDGVVVDTSVPGYSGTGFVSGFDAATDTVTVNTTITKAGLYDLLVAYIAPYGDKQASVLLNGAGSGSVSFTSTVWANASAGQVLLNAGVNTIGIQTNWGWYDIDAFYLTPSAPPAPHSANKPPVNSKAIPVARSLLKYVQKHYANTSSLLSGQQAGTYLSGDLSTDSISFIQQATGKSPALGGFDFIDYSPSRVAFGTTSNNTEQAFAWDKKGGIITFVWHWNAPTNLTNSDTEPWWSKQTLYYCASTCSEQLLQAASTLRRRRSTSPPLWRRVQKEQITSYSYETSMPLPCSSSVSRPLISQSSSGSFTKLRVVGSGGAHKGRPLQRRCSVWA